MAEEWSLFFSLWCVLAGGSTLNAEGKNVEGESKTVESNGPKNVSGGDFEGTCDSVEVMAAVM